MMPVDRKFGSTGHMVSPLGLGCSRLGSVLGASADEADRLLRTALDHGLSFFDTADIYAQGDSERLLGRTVGHRDDVIVCTKVGKHLPPLKRLLVPAKSLIRAVAKRNAGVSQGVRQSRAKPMPTDWRPAYLGRAIEASLGRLGRERIDLLMLHSPPAEVIARGEAVAALARARDAGKIGFIGISADDPASALLALRLAEVAAVQVPLHPGDESYRDVLAEAAVLGKAVVAREVLGGPNVIARAALERSNVQARLREAAATPGVTLALVGTTRTTHLLDAVAAFGPQERK